MNMTITDGRIGDKLLLEEMELDAYYSELKSYILMKKNEASAMEKAQNKESGRSKRR